MGTLDRGVLTPLFLQASVHHHHHHHQGSDCANADPVPLTLLSFALAHRTRTASTAAGPEGRMRPVGHWTRWRCHLELRRCRRPHQAQRPRQSAASGRATQRAGARLRTAMPAQSFRPALRSLTFQTYYRPTAATSVHHTAWIVTMRTMRLGTAAWLTARPRTGSPATLQSAAHSVQTPSATAPTHRCRHPS